MDTQNLYPICPTVPTVPTTTPAMTTAPTPPMTSKEPQHNENEKRKKPSNRSTLFWVHSDPQSASEGTREETLKRIRSHVMSEHNRKKRESTKRHTKTWKNLAFQPVETAATATATATASTTESKTTGPVVRRNPPKRQRSDGQTEVETVPWSLGGLDPFSVTHTQLSDRMCRHLQHCKLASSVYLYICIDVYVC